MVRWLLLGGLFGQVVRSVIANDIDVSGYPLDSQRGVLFGEFGSNVGHS
jgi:hypothetical protein